jgi:ferric-dicitrate binding protein FerR (iron transport regulator)
LAWKDGQFLFKDAPIENIMRQVERWYDAEIVYENKPADHFNVELSRDVPVSKMLRFLELTNRVHFKIENKKIVVSK